MIEPSEWTPTERMLFAVGLPLAVMIGALLLLGLIARSDGSATAAAAARETPAAAAARTREEANEERRDRYLECMKSRGVVRPSGLRGRFSRSPDPDEVRQASEVCRTLLALASRSRPAPRGPRTLPFA